MPPDVPEGPSRQLPWRTALPGDWAWVDRACERIADLLSADQDDDAVYEAESLVLSLRSGQGDPASLALARAQVMLLRATYARDREEVEAFDWPPTLADLNCEVIAATRALTARVAPPPERFTVGGAADPATLDAWAMHAEALDIFCACCWYDGGINFGFFDRELDERDRCAAALTLCGDPGELLRKTRAPLRALEGLTLDALTALYRRPAP